MTSLLVACVLAQQPFATSFDPWGALELGGGLVIDSAGASGHALGDLRFRGERESQSKAESTWLTLHRLAATELKPLQQEPALSVLGYTGVFRRHVREGVLLLPFNPPVRVPFPLDIAFSVEAARYERRWSEGTDWSFEPLRLSMAFDPLRSTLNRIHLSLGVTAAWKLRQRDGIVLQEITPLTAATVFFDFESEDGLWVARGLLSGGWSFIAPDVTLTLRARGEIELSRVLLALNDQPIALYVRATGAFRDAGARETSEWAAQLGLHFRLFSRR